MSTNSKLNIDHSNYSIQTLIQVDKHMRPIKDTRDQKRDLRNQSLLACLLAPNTQNKMQNKEMDLVASLVIIWVILLVKMVKQ